MRMRFHVYDNMYMYCDGNNYYCECVYSIITHKCPSGRTEGKRCSENTEI